MKCWYFSQDRKLTLLQTGSCRKWLACRTAVKGDVLEPDGKYRSTVLKGGMGREGKRRESIEQSGERGRRSVAAIVGIFIISEGPSRAWTLVEATTAEVEACSPVACKYVHDSSTTQNDGCIRSYLFTSYQIPGIILLREPTLSRPNFSAYHSFVPIAVTPRLVATKVVPQISVQFTIRPRGAARTERSA